MADALGVAGASIALLKGASLSSQGAHLEHDRIDDAPPPLLASSRQRRFRRWSAEKSTNLAPCRTLRKPPRGRFLEFLASSSKFRASPRLRPSPAPADEEEVDVVGRSMRRKRLSIIASMSLGDLGVGPWSPGRSAFSTSGLSSSHFEAGLRRCILRGVERADARGVGEPDQRDRCTTGRGARAVPISSRVMETLVLPSFLVGSGDFAASWRRRLREDAVNAAAPAARWLEEMLGGRRDSPWSWDIAQNSSTMFAAVLSTTRAVADKPLPARGRLPRSRRRPRYSFRSNAVRHAPGRLQLASSGGSPPAR